MLRAHGTRRNNLKRLKADLPKAFGVVYFVSEFRTILDQVKHDVPPALEEFEVMCSYIDPTHEQPWDAPILCDIYNKCAAAAARVKEWREKVMVPYAAAAHDASTRGVVLSQPFPASLMLCVCRGGKNRSRFAALLISLLNGDNYTGEDPEDAQLTAMAHSLATTPPTMDDARRVPAKAGSKRRLGM